MNLLGREVRRRVKSNPVEVELAAAGRLRQTDLLRRRREVVVAEFSDQAVELRVDSGLDCLADLDQKVLSPISHPVRRRDEELLGAASITLEHVDHVRRLHPGQVDAAFLLSGDLVRELRDPLCVLVEQMEVVAAILIVRDRGSVEHFMEDVQTEAAGSIRSHVEVRPVVPRRLDQQAEVPAQKFERKPILVVDGFLVDTSQPIEQVACKGRACLGGFQSPVRETLHLLAAPELEVRVVGGDEGQVLLAGGSDQLSIGGHFAGRLHAAGSEQWNGEDDEESILVAHDAQG